MTLIEPKMSLGQILYLHLYCDKVLIFSDVKLSYNTVDKTQARFYVYIVVCNAVLYTQITGYIRH